MQKAGRDAFVANHQMPPFEKVCGLAALDGPQLMPRMRVGA